MATMTVYFDNPYWVAVLELHDGHHVRAVRHVFGAEPTDAELYQYLLRNGGALLTRAGQATTVVASQPVPTPIRNPKRLARAAARAAAESRPSTAAQEAVKRDIERRRDEAARSGRERGAEHEEHRRQVRRAKARARHRGH